MKCKREECNNEIKRNAKSFCSQRCNGLFSVSERIARLTERDILIVKLYTDSPRRNHYEFLSKKFIVDRPRIIQIIAKYRNLYPEKFFREC